MSRVEYWRFTSVSANIAVVVFRVNVFYVVYEALSCVDQAVGGESDMKDVIGGSDERGAIQWGASTRL
jgi:hypothetical protein